MATPRISGKQFFVEETLGVGKTVFFPRDLQHRLGKVLRLTAGTEIHLCDGTTGRYRATLQEGAKSAVVEELHTPLNHTHNHVALWLGLPKREAFESALRQATELGVTTIQPILTRYSVPTKLNGERALTLVTEAAEQCERLTLPQLPALTKLDAVLNAFEGIVYWADETQAGDEPTPVKNHAAVAVLIGPEGGFSPEEQAVLRASPKVKILNLGPTILRTDTAVVAALAKVLL